MLAIFKPTGILYDKIITVYSYSKAKNYVWVKMDNLCDSTATETPLRREELKYYKDSNEWAVIYDA